MRLFQCQSCGQPLYFENTRCESCGARLGLRVDRMDMIAVEPTAGDETVFAPMHGTDTEFRFCDNARYDVCNWLVPADSAEIFCAACRLNRTIPNLDDAGNLDKWRKIEVAKHRLVYGLIRLGLSMPNKVDDLDGGLAFDFLANPEPALNELAQSVMTGHAAGVITINTIEADDAAREQARLAMAEPYRTLLGHFRHESGHFYWERLLRNSDSLETWRALFGDERADYTESLQHYYDHGAPDNWRETHISAYATSHPWEDWAECWAHYLHMVDTLETAHSFGIQLWPRLESQSALTAVTTFNPHMATDFSDLLDAWLPLVYAVNSLNRSMGLADFYPFMLGAGVIEKMDFVHRIIRGRP